MQALLCVFHEESFACIFLRTNLKLNKNINFLRISGFKQQNKWTHAKICTGCLNLCAYFLTNGQKI